MKWSELRRIAERNGWYFYRHGSKHDVYRHHDKDYPIEIERHDSQEIRSGLFYKLKKQIGF
ncbi:MAG: type II toxin-antitoxin system HicA family toxin [Prevotellaceae bacterium]|jgi:predicted RNA binding protein YcfA (HicA-like mRNA interferase family)|nr:type II toxin-antitoxin system HicA family toxin [Prevotellaceae bacterium]